MVFHRKYCVVFNNDEYKLASVPLDSFHRKVRNTVSGGFIYTTDDFALFYGESSEFKSPSLEQFTEILNEAGWYLSRMIERKQIRFSENSTLENAMGSYTIINEKFEY